VAEQMLSICEALGLILSAGKRINVLYRVVDIRFPFGKVVGNGGD
jgi:hypothetical protein